MKPSIKFTLTYLLLFLSLGVFSQTTGDYRSKASGNWNNYLIWQVYNGSSWVDAIAGQVPGGTSEADAINVYLEAGFTITLTDDASCKDLHLNTTQDVVRINTNGFALNVWGKMHNYTGTAPGNTDGTGAGINGWITTGAGSIKFRGTIDRTIFYTSEFGASSRTAGWTLNFAFDAGITGYCKNTIRCGYLLVSSGTLDISGTGDGEVTDYEIRIGGSDYTASPGNGVSDGTVTVKSGATLKSYRLHKNNPISTGNSLGSFTIEDNAIFVSKLNNQVPTLAYDIRGEVQFISSSAQSFLGTGGNVDAIPIVNYANVFLGGSSSKTLIANTSISGKLTLEGTASLALGSYSLSYGSNATLEYNGSTSQTTTDNEFPVSNSPYAVNINNSNGVKLHANRSISGQLSLLAGTFDLQNYNFTLGENSPAVSGTLSSTNMIVTSGTGELRKIFSNTGNYFFPVGELTGTGDYSYAKITINSADVLDATTYVGIRVIDSEHPADQGTASGDISRYWGVSSNISNINYSGNFQYLSSDVNGTEDSINAYVYQDETPLASGSPLNRVDPLFHRINISNQSAVGFVTGANFCRLANNIIGYSGTGKFCSTGVPSSPFTGTSATVTSGTPVYQWQQKINTGLWINISSGGNSKDYTESGTLTGPGLVYYRRTIFDPGFCLAADSSSSNNEMIIIQGDLSGNQIGTNQTITDGSNAAAFTSIGTLTGGDTTYTYQWQSSSSSGGPYIDIPSSTSDVYDPGILHSTTYYVRKVQSGVCPTSVSNEVSITVTPLASVQDLEILYDLKVYPNPTTNALNINFSNVNSENVVITLTDNKGVTLFEKNVSSNNVYIDVSKYASGVYFLQITSGKKSSSYKISKR